jgi:alpha-tubulin suppressor-like RCC1 family protein
MPTFYNYTENGVVYSFDDVFVPADAFRQGNLWTWGNNSYGRLGTNDALSRTTPVTTFAGGTNWKQVAGGDSHTAAIKTDGTLWTWGRNNRGQIGDDTLTNRSTPVTTFAGGTNWKQVACGSQHTAAIRGAGELWVWGRNGYGQLGDNTTTGRLTPVTTFAGGTNWKQVGAGRFSTYAVKTDGTLWAWGVNSYAQLGINAGGTSRSTPITTFAGGNNWKQVSGGYNFAAAIKNDGTLWSWGRNDGGQLGINDVNTRSTPVTTFAGGNNWSDISNLCGSRYNSAIKTDGTLWTWGRNSYGNLGDNTTTDRLTPVTTFSGGTNWKQVANGGSNSGHTAAIKTDGTLWIWGLNTSGQLGDNTTVSRQTPVTTFAGGTNWKQVSCGERHIAALTYIDDYV